MIKQCRLDVGLIYKVTSSDNGYEFYKLIEKSEYSTSLHFKRISDINEGGWQNEWRVQINIVEVRISDGTFEEASPRPLSRAGC